MTNPSNFITNSSASDNDWWRGAIIYQIYPRSFVDSDNDGVGDIRGCINKIDYIASLGVDAIWLSPFFKSPMDDFGYDISDYRQVDPLFGSLEDIDELISLAHERNIKIMIDQVLSHTSADHAWFQESREDKINAKADWYVWADSSPDGSPPNNWLSIFGGVAWEWEPRRQQYYLHNFLKSQPDLNFHNPEVQQQILDEVEFWLKRGIDGLRLDAINFCFHDQELRDNPAKPIAERNGRGFSADNPYAYQYHYFNNTQPENLNFLANLRKLCNQYPGTVTLGEVSSEDSLQTMLDYTDGNEHLHMAYSFELLIDEFSKSHIIKTVEDFVQRSQGGWPCWAFSNHDVKRVASRWADNAPNAEQQKMLTTLLTSLQGSVCLYQGEELGLNEADVAYEDLQDPYGIAFWPRFKGRDGCRTPMPWENSPSAGFSQQKPWLPIPKEHQEIAVSIQDGDEKSVLNHFRSLLHWRKQQPALIQGNIEFIDSHENIIAFIKKSASQTLVCLFNISGKTTAQDLSSTLGNNISATGFKEMGPCAVSQGIVTLAPYGVFFGEYETP